MRDVHWQDVFSGAAVVGGAIALVIAVGNVGDDAEKTARNVADAELTRNVEQNVRNTQLGCERSADRLEAQILSEAADAMGNTAVSQDTSLSQQTREARRRGANISWETAATLAATLIDCDKAFPQNGKPGKNVVDVQRLHRVRVRIEKVFGDIDPQVLKRIAKLMRKKQAEQAARAGQTGVQP